MARLAGILLLSVLAVSHAQAQSTMPPTEAAALTHLVKQDCGSCHGLTLKGGLGRAITARALAPYDVAALRDIILHGIPGTPMPPWEGLVDARQATWIAEQLKEGAFE